MRARRLSPAGFVGLSALCGTLSAALAPDASAIEVRPTSRQVAAELEAGRRAAASRLPPDRLYEWFGPTSELAPHGFLMTKLTGVRVMAAHFALRGAEPGPEELERVLADDRLLVTVIIYGDRRDFAVDTYLVLLQGPRTITPRSVRADGTASRSAVWPGSPAYRAKVVAFVPYADLDPLARTRISVFPGSGGEISFDLDLSDYP